MNRSEHLQWCKDRALEYLESGDPQSAFASMVSDVMKHEETSHHETTNMLGMQMLIAGHLHPDAKMEAWINGYN